MWVRGSSAEAGAETPMTTDTHDQTRTHEHYLNRMCHELRTPLNAVIGFSRALERNRAGNQRPEDIELLTRIRANGEQLLQVIEVLLTDVHRTRQGSF